MHFYGLASLGILVQATAGLGFGLSFIGSGYSALKMLTIAAQ